MNLKMTKTELITEVSKFYSRQLSFEKALDLFELEYGYKPEIIEKNNLVNEGFVKSMGYPWFVTPEALTFMKELQESGATNMFGATPYIQNALGLSKNNAKELLMIYMKDYNEIYYPETLI